MTYPAFLFTDIEGSTPLWEQHPEAMSRALARHDALLSSGSGTASSGAPGGRRSRSAATSNRRQQATVVDARHFFAHLTTDVM
jgi:hypothetical protein